MPRHVQHCNVNCRDLATSRAFYESLGFTPLVRTHPDPQDGSGFGLGDDAQWDAWMMSDGRANPVIDLLQWIVPPPAEPAAGGGAGRGLVALRVATPTVDRPQTIRDPDGIALELEPGEELRILGVVIGVADPAASARWYRDALGFVGDDLEVHLPGDDFLVAFRQGAGPVAASASEIGIYRMAVLVDDIAAAVDDLRARGVACPDAVWLDMGPTIPVDGLWAAFFFDPDGTCLELIGAPEVR